MHCAGPSLTQSADASTAVQAMTGENFGAATLTPGDDAALLKWWTAHRDAHAIVLDHLVCHVVRRAEQDLDRVDAKQTGGVWCAVKRLGRVLGEPVELPADASAEALRARLEDLANEWLLRNDAGRSRRK